MASQMVHKEDTAVILKPIARSFFFFLIWFKNPEVGKGCKQLKGEHIAIRKPFNNWIGFRDTGNFSNLFTSCRWCGTLSVPGVGV